MIHDRLCFSHAPDTPEGTEPVCSCPYIARIRADERMEAKGRLRSVAFAYYKKNMDKFPKGASLDLLMVPYVAAGLAVRGIAVPEYGIYKWNDKKGD